MEGQKYLGIYLSKDTATVVCLGLEGRDYKVLGCFSVSVEQQEPQEQFRTGAVNAELAHLIVEGCAERKLKFSEVAVALDCSMFMQHNVRSEFDDPKQIAATIRFDTEEALAMDVTDVAIAFRITSSDQTGSQLTVFTAERKILSDVLLSLQANNIDPVTIEPDVNCLSRFILQNMSLSEDLHPLFCAFSRRSGYFIIPPRPGVGAQKRLAMRTFLVGPTQDRGDLLTREAPVAIALGGTEEPVNCLKVYDSTGSVNCKQLGERLDIEVGSIDLAEAAAVEPDALADCDEAADFAIAYGAALAHLERAQSINFRNDFMPYQGRKVRLQKALKFASISVIVLVFAVGLYFQLQLLQKNKYRTRLREKFAKDYLAVMLDEKKLPARAKEAVRKVGGELRRVKDAKSGQLSITGEASIAAKLTLVLEAFNKCAAQTNLKINKVSITPKAISIVGDTSSRKNTLKLFEAIKDKLEILQHRYVSKAGRDNFSMTVAPKE